MAEVRRLREEFSAILVDILRRGVAAGAFTTAEPRLTAVQIFGMTNWAWTWFVPGGRLDAVAIADQFSRTVIGGLAPGATREGAAAARLAAAVGDAMRAHRPEEEEEEE